ncbi:diguanylate cyclase domain-containing protein [Clostridium hydrogenum]|uniref:diguanylate cyclase domain-containing protein n=1 Tax=Clostridium hydrogenum TaxID=2855764 RepID=UPI001F30055B|nr:diguanylate cyclase [Clostridium hydrogenum]
MKKRIISIAAAIIVSSILLYIFFVIQKEQFIASNNSNRLLALEKLTSVNEEIQTEVNESLQYANFFDVIISKNPDITKQIINDYAKLILKQNPNIDNVQLAPNGVVSMIYPLKGNETAIGHNLLTDPNRRKYSEEAIKKRIAVTQGPVKAIQGGYLVFNRKAIFITENGKERFWGFSTVAINFTKLMKKYNDKLKKQNYLFALKSNSEDKKQASFWGDYSIFKKDSIVKTIELPDNEWQMAIYPKDGWNEKNKSSTSLRYFFYIVTLLTFFLIYWSSNFYQEKIEEAKIEVLTGTLNKRAFKAFVHKKLLKKNQMHGIILIDLNNFKEINDKLGHPIGDAVLIKVSKRINEVLQKKDKLSRFGGDEYLIFLGNIKNVDDVKKILDNIVKHVALPMVIGDIQLKIGISAGYSIYSKDGETFNELYEVSDKRMYENKKNNKSFNKSEYIYFT